MKPRGWLSLILAFVIFTAVLAWIKVAQIREGIAIGKAFGEPKEVVELAVVEEAQWQPMVSVTADVVAIQALELRNELGGRIVELGFKSGEPIKKGQLLVRLDTREEEAQLAAAKADAELAGLALERNLKLARQGVASEEARDQAQAQRSSAVALEDRLQAVIDKKIIRAPFDGMAGIYTLEIGEYLQANTAITRLVGTQQQVWLDFNLPQQQLSLQVGDSISVQAVSFTTKSMPAKIIARDTRVNPRSGNLRFRAVADNEAGLLFPGTVVSVSVPAAEPQTVTRVPMTAVRFDAFGANVYVLEPAEPEAAAEFRAVRRPVELGPQFEQKVVVKSGLQAGEKVAGNGAFKLREGILVKAVVVNSHSQASVPENLPAQEGTAATEP